MCTRSVPVPVYGYGPRGYPPKRVPVADLWYLCYALKNKNAKRRDLNNFHAVNIFEGLLIKDVPYKNSVPTGTIPT